MMPKSSHSQAVIIAATSTNSGKTQVSAGIIKLLIDKGYTVSAAKIGPDYIDTGFQRMAGALGCYNLDCWAMRKESCDWFLHDIVHRSDYTIIEGVMGLFDSALGGNSSTAEFAKRYNLPIILVVSAQSVGQSIGAVVHGFCHYDSQLKIAGVIINQVMGKKHQKILQEGLKNISVPILGYIFQDSQLQLPQRHLGLVQAQEQLGLKKYFTVLCDALRRYLDIEMFLSLMRSAYFPVDECDYHHIDLFPQSSRIAIAYDEAFSFVYMHFLRSWQIQEKEVCFFSPLQDERPDKDADAVFLPGGYPELYAYELSQKHVFFDGLQEMAKNKCIIYGECGGYMVLGDHLKDAQGKRHRMAGLLPVVTDFSKRVLCLGYRNVYNDVPILTLSAYKNWKGHEFHYSQEQNKPSYVSSKYTPLFSHVSDTYDTVPRLYGMKKGSVYGSYIHLIDYV